MVFEITREQEGVFERCKVDSLDARTTSLIQFATQLAVGNERGAKDAYRRGARVGLSSTELSRAACLAACSSGPRVTATYAEISGKSRRYGGLFGWLFGSSARYHVDAGSVFAGCTEKTFDDRTHHLVSLAVCLASNCACASGHLVRLRELEVDEGSVHRAACLAAEEGGLRIKYSYIEHLENVRTARDGSAETLGAS